MRSVGSPGCSTTREPQALKACCPLCRAGPEPAAPGPANSSSCLCPGPGSLEETPGNGGGTAGSQGLVSTASQVIQGHPVSDEKMELEGMTGGWLMSELSPNTAGAQLLPLSPWHPNGPGFQGLSSLSRSSPDAHREAGKIWYRPRSLTEKKVKGPRSPCHTMCLEAKQVLKP